MITTSTTTTANAPVLPVTIRLPRVGQRDPIFGLSRAFYFSLEKQGVIELIRLRTKGRTRGVTLIPVERMAQVLKEQMVAA